MGQLHLDLSQFDDLTKASTKWYGRISMHAFDFDFFLNKIVHVFYYNFSTHLAVFL